LSALICAALNGYTFAVELLITAGADIATKAKNG
jgi:hypothetical protein